MHALRLDDIDTHSLKGRVLYKDKGGFTPNAALSACSEAEIVFLIPRGLGATSITVDIYSAHIGERLSREAAWTKIDGDRDVYALPLDLPAGLYFFDLTVASIFGYMHGHKSGGDIIFDSIPSGDRFQLTVSDFKYDSPTCFYGGIIYHVFVDRFARHGAPYAKQGTIIADYSDGIPEFPKYPGAPLKNNTFYGGSLYGVIDKLDYIASLSANIIYLSPIFESPSNHKYDTADYLKVDEAFGGEEALKSLIAAAHKRGLKIILDGVFNHTGADSVYFNRYSTYESLGAYQSKESPYYDWYEFQSHPDKYTCWWDIEILPRINTQNKSCADFFIGKRGVIEKYVKMGIDGLRLDVADELSDCFIADIKSVISNNKKENILYGEVWEDASNKIAYSTRKRYYLGAELDGVMNYPLRRGIIDYLSEKRCDSLHYALTEVMRNAPLRVMHAQMNLLGTHDTERILTVLGGDRSDGLENCELAKKRMTVAQRERGTRLLKLAYAVLATLPGIPAIFYGDEAGLEGYGDPFNRMPYPWGNENEEILDFYKKIGIIRRGQDVYSDGEFLLNHLDSELLIFTRQKDGDALVTAVNNSQRPILLCFSDDAMAELANETKRMFSLDSLSVEIFKIASDVTLTVEVQESVK